MNTTAQPTLNIATQSRAAAALLSVVLTLAMLLGVNHLATSDAPASSIAQITSARA